MLTLFSRILGPAWREFWLFAIQAQITYTLMAFEKGLCVQGV